MCGGCCVHVWEVSAINRFIYASSVQQPNTRLLGSDSEYRAIKRSSDTRLTHTLTHMYNDFVNHTLMYSQSQRPVRRPHRERAVHTHTSCMEILQGAEKRRRMTSNLWIVQLIRNYRSLNLAPQITSVTSYRDKILLYGNTERNRLCFTFPIQCHSLKSLAANIWESIKWHTGHDC